MIKILYFLAVFIFTNIAYTQIVNIPDANFKAALIEEGVDTNNDGEIQFLEAEAVISLFISYNQIVSVEGIQSFTNLNYFYAYNNLIEEIDLSQNIDLVYIDLSGNSLSEVDLTNNINLENIKIGSNNLSEIDLTQNINLVNIEITNNELTELDLTLNINLINIEVGSNLLTNLAVPNNNSLESLRCSWNQFSELTIVNPNIKTIISFNNPNNYLDVTQCPNLENLQFKGTFNLTNIDLTQNVNLKWLILSKTNISSLDLSQNLNLTEFFFSQNYNIETIDFSNNPELTYVDCRNNNLVTLDFSQNYNLQNLDCPDNSLISLNVKNGNNTVLADLYTINNPELNCIQVDDVTYAEAQTCVNYAGWCIDETTVYSEDCPLLVINEYNNDFVIYPNPVNSILYIENNEIIKQVQVYNLLGEQIFTKTEETKNIDFSNLGKGIYFIKIETYKGITFKRIIKE